MVGAPTSNRCDTCKQRKIKCDENWPICGQCTRSRRHCPGPPSRLRFVNRLGPRQRSPSVLSAASESPEVCSSPRLMVPVRSRSAQYGGLFHKMRLRQSPPKKLPSSSSPEDGELLAFEDLDSFAIPKPVPQTKIDELTRAFVSQLSITDIRYRLLPYGEFLAYLPQRCGFSAALDDSAICYLTAHASLLRGAPPRKWIVPKLYGRALCSLQSALNDPKERFSTNTLAATALMNRLEQTYSSAWDTKAVIHAGGMYRSLLSRGPPNPEDPLEVYLALENTGPVMSYTMLHDKFCFLDTPEWKNRHLAISDFTYADQMYYHLLDRMAAWPGLARDVKALRHSPQLVDRDHVLARARDFVSSMREFGHMMQPFFEDGESIIEVPSIYGDPLVPIMYRFGSLRHCCIAMFYWYASLCGNRILMELEDSPEVLTELSIANMDFRQSIWMTWEYVEDHQPLGCPFAQTGFLYSYEGAYAPMDQWVLDKVQILENYRGDERIHWTPEWIFVSFAVATGRYP